MKSQETNKEASEMTYKEALAANRNEEERIEVREAKEPTSVKAGRRKGGHTSAKKNKTK